jgi:hypothetical protein
MESRRGRYSLSAHWLEMWLGITGATVVVVGKIVVVPETVLTEH